MCRSKLRLKPTNVCVAGPSLVIIRPDGAKHGNALNAELQRLNSAIPHVVVAGLPSVSRAVIAIDDTVVPNKYKLCVEGMGLSQVIATYGVIGNKTRSNNICEIYQTLGIEAARTTIMNEITDVMEGHGMTVDHRHIMLLASQMTSRGEVLGITRHGLAKMRESVFNLASVSNDRFFFCSKFKHNGRLYFHQLSLKKLPIIYLTPPIMDKPIQLTAYPNVLSLACRPQSVRASSN